MPRTEPVNEPIVAAAVLLLAHVPPGELVNVFVAPTHDTLDPLIAVGEALTVTGAVTEVLPQPFVTV